MPLEEKLAPFKLTIGSYKLMKFYKLTSVVLLGFVGCASIHGQRNPAADPDSIAATDSKKTNNDMPECDIHSSFGGAYVTIDSMFTGKKHFRGYAPAECDLAQLDAEKLQEEGKCQDIYDDCRPNKGFNPKPLGLALPAEYLGDKENCENEAQIEHWAFKVANSTLDHGKIYTNSSGIYKIGSDDKNTFWGLELTEPANPGALPCVSMVVEMPKNGSCVPTKQPYLNGGGACKEPHL
jgi:hypothetical protein